MWIKWKFPKTTNRGGDIYTHTHTQREREKLERCCRRRVILTAREFIILILITKSRKALLRVKMHSVGGLPLQRWVLAEYLRKTGN